MEKLFGFVTRDRAQVFARLSLALMFVWFGAMNFTGVGAGIVGSWFSIHMMFSGLGDAATGVAMAVGVVQILAGLALAFGRGVVLRIGAATVAVFAFYSLTLLVLANVWIDTMGGFPAIGAGQGIIKYVTILGIALYLGTASEQNKQKALVIALVGLIIVLGWIGGMKFTAVEAAGIKPLLESSWIFAWVLPAFGEQGASNVIGVVEIVTALLLTGWFWNRTLFLGGAALCVLIFFGTLSFMVTLPGWEETLGGFPALSRSGHFLLKDLVLLAGVFLLVANRLPAKANAAG